MISKELERIIALAIHEVKQRNHEFLSLEHILYAFLLEENGKKFLQGCGIDMQMLQKEMEKFFDTYSDILSSEKQQENILQTIGVQRVLQRSILHVKSAGKESVCIGDFLAALLEEEDSYAVYFLQVQGIKRLDVLQYIANEMDNKTTAQEEKQSESFLNKFCTDLIAQAEIGKIDPLIGRKQELKRMLQILARRRKNNPLLVGEPGIGKTALAEGLALQAIKNELPKQFQNVRLFLLDMGGLVAGTKYRGDFEARLKGVVKELEAIPGAVLVIDEIHTLVGSGSGSGSLDGSNILKPALAAGTLRCIGSTTFEEYKSAFEKDRALSRRFQKIEIKEPSVNETCEILEGLKSAYEKHHGVHFLPSALQAAAELSDRYINDRFLPDKAIDVMDEAGAMRLLDDKKQKNISKKDIEQIISMIAKVPTKTLNSSRKDRVLQLEKNLKKSLFGQDEAVCALTRAIKRSSAGLNKSEKPLGTFLLTGPTGVGKTELAKQLAKNLDIAFLRFDMSEYMESHTVARLIGSPPGYVGFEQSGLLTEAVRRQPHCVLLLDEIEKAHPDIFNILLQVMDYATLTDNNGRQADFRHVILLMTSNAGTKEMSGLDIGFQRGDRTDQGTEAVKKLFSPEFRNRLDDIIRFQPLGQEIAKQIVDKFLAGLNDKLIEKKICLKPTSAAKNWLVRKGFDPEFGARPLSRLIQSAISDQLADKILAGELRLGGTVRIDAPKNQNDELHFSDQSR